MIAIDKKTGKWRVMRLIGSVYEIFDGEYDTWIQAVKVESIILTWPSSSTNTVEFDPGTMEIGFEITGPTKSESSE